MFEIILSVLFGITVGFLFARYILIAPGPKAKTFADYLKKYGIVGSTGGITIGLPIVCLFAFKKSDIHGACWLAYFSSLLVSAIFAFIYICKLLLGSVPEESVPPSIVKSHKKNLLLTLLLEGYPAVNDHLEALRTLTQVSIKTALRSEQLHKQLYGDDQQTRRRLADESNVTPKNLDLIRKHLRCSEAGLKIFIESVKRHYKINT
jgi:hypothetical protein